MASSTLTITPYSATPAFVYFSPEPRPQSPLPHSTSNAHPNRHSFPSSSSLWKQHQRQIQHVHEFQEKPLRPPPPSPRARGPRLSLDTSQERLQNITLIQHGNQSYLKLFSPTLVESPVSFLSTGQLIEDAKLWENGPDEALEKRIEMERREVYHVRSRQQLRGFVLGIWLGCLMGLMIVQQTAATVYIPSYLARRDTSPLLFFMVFISCLAAMRSGTRCIVAAIATCAAVLTCFATLVANHSRYSVEFRVYGSNPAPGSS